MKDYLGKELNPGDTVIYIIPGYREYGKGTVKRLTKHYVFIEIKNIFYGDVREKKQFPSSLIKIENGTV